MEKETLLDGVAKWILPALGILFIAQQIFGFGFELAF